VDQRQESLGGMGITAFDGVQDLRDVGHNPRVYSRRTRQANRKRAALHGNSCPSEPLTPLADSLRARLGPCFYVTMSRCLDDLAAGRREGPRVGHRGSAKKFCHHLKSCTRLPTECLASPRSCLQEELPCATPIPTSKPWPPTLTPKAAGATPPA